MRQLIENVHSIEQLLLTDPQDVGSEWNEQLFVSEQRQRLSQNLTFDATEEIKLLQQVMLGEPQSIIKSCKGDWKKIAAMKLLSKTTTKPIEVLKESYAKTGKSKLDQIYKLTPFEFLNTLANVPQ